MQTLDYQMMVLLNLMVDQVQAPREQKDLKTIPQDQVSVQGPQQEQTTMGLENQTDPLLLALDQTLDLEDQLSHQEDQVIKD